ncbi:MAG: NAD(P)H-hydrate dehydratase [Moraxella sp.]|nr:NAD(P)H-hydrate dehydratase [Moraxella sp.]
MTHPLDYFIQRPKRHAVYDVKTVQAWERHWFETSGSYPLMKQVAYLMALSCDDWLGKTWQNLYAPKIVVVCGRGNNGGDGYWVGYHLSKMGHDVTIIVPDLPVLAECRQTYQDVVQVVSVSDDVGDIDGADVVVDGLFGIGLDRVLSDEYIRLIHAINVCPIKIALDMPSGLSSTGYPLPVAVRADVTLCAIAPKVGLLTGQGRTFAGRIIPINILPPDDDCPPVAYLDTSPVQTSLRPPHAHKGDFGHVYVIGGHPNMGGAVMMASESAMAVGAGKLTVVCHHHHHAPILARSPNVMVKDAERWDVAELDGADVVAFGMGLGRDDWARERFLAFFKWLNHMNRQLTTKPRIILDADGLYWLSRFPQTLPDTVICTPHSAEAGRLLGKSAGDVEQDRLGAIHELAQNYGASWVLKGAGTLTLEHDVVNICPYGNPKMATAGMGDVLSGVIAGLVAQGVGLSDCVKIHAQAGDELVKDGQVMAHQMAGVLTKVVG